jgi:hypothetical protein
MQHHATPRNTTQHTCNTHATLLLTVTVTAQDALNFPARCAALCERHCTALMDFTGERGDVVALDIGCALKNLTLNPKP